MNIRKLAATIGIAFGVGALAAAPAWAVDNIKPFGDQIRVVDTAGNTLIGYTVTDFGPSSDPVDHAGQLYAATLTVQAYGIPANPMISQFGARAQSGEGYRVIADAPGGISGAQVPADSSSTGKLYFDVTGDVPNSVVYSDFLRDVFAWVPGPSRGGTQP